MKESFFIVYKRKGWDDPIMAIVNATDIRNAIEIFFKERNSDCDIVQITQFA